MNESEPIDWPARKARALAYMDIWRRERADAQRHKRAMLPLPLYDYEEHDDATQTTDDQPTPQLAERSA